MVTPFVRLLFLSTFVTTQDCQYPVTSSPVCIASLPCSTYSVAEIRNGDDHEACIQEVKKRMAFNNCSEIFALAKNNNRFPYYLQCAMDRYESRVESTCGYIPKLDYPETKCFVDCEKKPEKFAHFCYEIVEVCKKRLQNSSRQDLIPWYTFQYESLYKNCINSVDLDL